MDKYLILCPHPDDELHINFKALVINPRNIIIAIFTTGKAGVDENHNLYNSELVSERYKETIMGMSELGIEPEQIIFLGYSDGREDEELTLNTRETRINKFILSIEYLCMLYQPSKVFAPIPLELHIDHKYVGYALLKSNIKAKKFFSCYPRTINISKEDFIDYIEDDVFDKRVILAKKIYKTQKFLGKKLESSLYKYDKFWLSETVEKMLSDDEVYDIKDIYSFSKDVNYRYLFDDLVSKKIRVSEVLLKKYSKNDDPWGYRNKNYEKVRFKVLSSLIFSNIKKSERIIDMGCGNGEFIKKVCKNGYLNIIGFDSYTRLNINIMQEYSSIQFLPYDFNKAIDYLIDNKVSVNLFIFNDSIYYIHITEYIKLLERIINNFSEAKLLLSGGNHFDIKEYLAYTLKYYNIFSGKVFSKSKNDELLCLLFKRKQY